MKRIIQLILFFVIILTSLIFYQTYLKNIKEPSPKNNVTENKLTEESQNNLIKNLKYDVNFDNGTSYSITALESELLYENNNEIVSMKDVEAIFVNEDNEFLKITSFLMGKETLVT